MPDDLARFCATSGAGVSVQVGAEIDANGAAAKLNPDEYHQLLSVLARAASPDERRAGGWLRAIPGDGHAHKRYRHWAARVADGDEARARQILAARGLTPQTWRDSLREVEVDTTVASTAWPAWARTVVELLEMVPRTAPMASEPGASEADIPTLAEVVGNGLPDWVDGSAPWRFYPGFRAWWRAARAAVTRFDDNRKWKSRPLSTQGSMLTPAAQADLALGAVRRLLAVSGPRLMAAADAADQPLFSMSPRADWLALFCHYPVLARVLATTWLQWHETTAELVARIHHDVPLVASLDHTGPAANPKADQATDPDSTPQVVRFATGEGDSHAGGRSVAEVELSDGATWFLKPRNSGGQQALSAVFDAVSAAGDPLELQLPETIERDGYCWVRKVTRADCHSPADVASYFFRAGILTRVLQALGATDFHHENVIPVGAQPVLIDLETVFGPGGGWRVAGVDDSDESDPPVATQAVATEAATVARIMADTPAATSMISSFVDGPPGRDSVDIGALAGPSEALTPYLVAHLEPTPAGPQLRRKRVPLVTGEALPTQGGARVAATEYAAEVIAGYAEGDRRLRACPSADALLTRDNPGVRYVARPTQVYSRLLALSLGPAALSDGIERAMVIERLWRAAGTCPPQLIVAEAAALERLDVPMFTAEFTSTDLLTDTGERIVDAHATSPRAAAIARLGRIHTRSDAVDDLCAALFAMNPDLPPRAAGDVRLAGSANPATAMADAAVHLGGHRRAWLGVDLDPSRNRWRHQRLSPGLLGEAGIGLALVASGVLLPTSDNNSAFATDAGDANTAHDHSGAGSRGWLAEVTQIGRTTLLTCAERMADFRPEWSSADAFAGPAGTMYALAKAAALSDDEELRTAAHDLLPAVLAAARAGSHRDLLDSRAGAVLALLHLEPSPQLDHALAEVCALLAADLAHARGPQGDPSDSWWLAQMPSLRAGRALALHRLCARQGLAELGDCNASDNSATHARAAVNDLAVVTDLANTALAQWLDAVDLAQLRPGDACVAIEIGVIPPPTMPAPPMPARPMTLPSTNQKSPAAADGNTRALLDDMSIRLSARDVVGTGTDSDMNTTLAKLVGALHANRRRDGRWFTDVIVTDRRNFSVVHSLAAATIGVLATHPACPHVRVLA